MEALSITEMPCQRLGGLEIVLPPRLLERIYIGRRFKNDTERLEKLFELYTKMTAENAKTTARTSARAVTVKDSLTVGDEQAAKRTRKPRS